MLSALDSSFTSCCSIVQFYELLLDSVVLRVVARSFIQVRNIYRGRENSLSAMMLMMTMLLLIVDVVTCSDISLLSEKYDVEVIIEVIDEIDVCRRSRCQIAYYLLLIIFVQLVTCTFTRWYYYLKMLLLVFSNGQEDTWR